MTSVIAALSFGVIGKFMIKFNNTSFPNFLKIINKIQN